MKCNICISLDEEIVKQLKQENNYSDLINEQLRQFYYTKEVKDKGIIREKIRNLKQISKENDKKVKEMQTILRKLRAREKKVIPIKKEIKKLDPEKQKLLDDIRKKGGILR